MNHPWATTVVIALSRAHKYHIKMSRNGIIILVLVGSMHMDSVACHLVLQPKPFAVRNVNLDLMKDRNSEEVEVYLASVLFDLVLGEVEMVLLNDKA